jgi:hypothetical protein
LAFYIHPVLIPKDGVAAKAKVFHFGINGIVPEHFSNVATQKLEGGKREGEV